MEASFIQAKQAGKSIAGLSDEWRNGVLRAVADELVSSKEELLRANAEDLARMDPSSPLYDRLMLTDARIEAIAADMRNVASLPSPLGRVLLDRILPNGLHLRKVAVPFGVIGVIYEARPNVTLDVFSLCFKSGNACVLKGGKDADASNRAAVAIVQRVLAGRGARGGERAAERRRLRRRRHPARRPPAHRLCPRQRSHPLHRDGGRRGEHVF